MFGALIIVFREIIEAGLVVGIALAATRGVPGRGLWVGYGILGGIAGACLVAAFASSISAAMQGAGQELFNVTILLIAILMLAWHNVWVARHGREMAMKAVGEAVAAGHRSLVALSIVVGIAVLREGAEIVLFLYGIAISGNDTAATMAAGGTFGLLLGGVGAALNVFWAASLSSTSPISGDKLAHRPIGGRHGSPSDGISPPGASSDIQSDGLGYVKFHIGW